jgi:hypothetical protein
MQQWCARDFRKWVSIMPGTYRISAVPVLHTGGAFKGKLKGVSFTAASANNTVEWFSNNCGHFELAFSRIMPRSMAQAVVVALMRGDDVELPGLYAMEEFARGFLFEWSPVHFVVPPQFAQEYPY